MTDRNSFMETIRTVAEIVQTAEAPLSDTEMLSYFSDMDLNDEQKQLVLDYLTTQKTENDESSEESDGADKLAILQVYLDEISALPVYTKEECLKMYQALLSGEEKMIPCIVEMWLPKVTEIAKKYEMEKIPVEDLIQEGNMALLLKLHELCGIGNGAPDLMAQQLEGGIETAIVQYASRLEGEQELEAMMRGKISLVHEATRLLKRERGHEPSLEELAEYTKLPKKELTDIMDMLDKILEK